MAANPPWTDEELLLALAIADARGWRGGNRSTPEFLALSVLLRRANFPGATEIDERFRSVNSVSMKIANLVGANPGAPGGMRKSKKEVVLVETFMANRENMLAEAAALRDSLTIELPAANVSSIDVADEELALVAAEGDSRYVLALRRERSRPLREAKIRTLHRASRPVACEVCRFDFLAMYGELGRDYVEVHHRTPLHVSGETSSNLDDLAVLCANCHRMIHRRGWIAVDQLSSILREQEARLAMPDILDHDATVIVESVGGSVLPSHRP